MNNPIKHYLLNYIFYMLLFLFAFRFWKASVLFFMLFVTICVVAASRKVHPIPRNLDFLFLTLSFLSYFLIDQIHHGSFDPVYLLSQAFHLLSMPLAYWMGWILIRSQSIEKKEATFRHAIFVLAAGGSAYAFLSHIKKLAYPDLFLLAFSRTKYAYLGVESHGAKRSVLDLWNNDIIVATEYNMHYLYLIALFPLIFFYDKNNQKYKMSIIALLPIWAAYVTGSRSNIMLIIFSILFGIWYKISQDPNKKNLNSDIHNGTGKTSVKIVRLIIVTLLIAIFLLFLLDVSNILDRSLFNERGLSIKELVNDARWTFAFNVLKNIQHQPFGNMNIDWAHNVWLDVAHEVGFIPMIFLILFSIQNSILAKKVWQTFEKNSISRLIALSTLFLINISFFLEPVIKGSTQHFLFYTLIVGMLNGYQVHSAQIMKHLEEKGT